MITASGLTKVFKTGDVEVHALRGVDLTVAAGEFLAITGRSGSGKSTLMYQLSALDYPTTGSITVDGRDIIALSPNERTEFRLNELGYVFQDYALLPELTAIENVMLPLLMQGYREQEARARAAVCMADLGLGDRLNNKPNQLSGGQQQRVSIARAVCHEPHILFADEPTANLDLETSRDVLESFIALNARGQTIVMVTHEPEYAALAGRVVELSDGMIISDKKRRVRRKKAS